MEVNLNYCGFFLLIYLVVFYCMLVFFDCDVKIIKQVFYMLYVDFIILNFENVLVCCMFFMV